MTQLIVNGIYLPETSKDKYQCYPGELSVNVEMISGRTVREVRGHVQMITWSYDYMGNTLWRQLAAVLRGNTSICRTTATRWCRARFWWTASHSPPLLFPKAGWACGTTWALP